MADPWSQFKDAAPSDPWSGFKDAGATSAPATAPEPWNDPAMPVTRDLKTIPRALKHALMQAGNLVGVVSDEDVKKHRADMQADPYYSKVGDVLGGMMAMAPVASIGTGAGIINAGLANAAAGGIFSDPGQRGFNAAVGGAAGTAAEGAMKMLPLASNWIGNKFLNNTAGRISAKNKLGQAATDAAYEAGAIRPWKTIRGAANTLEDASNAAGERVGAAVSDIGKTTGATVDAMALHKELLATGRAIQARSGNPAEYEPYFWAARDVLTKGRNGQIPLDVAESIKTSFFKRAKPAFGTVQGADVPATPGAWRHVGSTFRKANEAAAQAAGATPEQMAEFMAAKGEFGPLKDAFRAAGEGAARSGNRSFLGMPEAMMLASEGLGPTAALKMSRTFLPQTAGYAAWRGGQAMSEPTANLLVRALAAEAASRDDK